ncbi:MAG: FAD binding domain-containing protein [Thaumarchaeota archaeon]|nr:FAD binding domain-containing protein [Nitrososphaerota archaeon]
MSQAFKPTKFLKPKTIEETSALLKEYGASVRIISGGTGIYEVAHRGLLSEIDCLIDLSSLNLSYIRVDESSVRIGATTTMSSMMDTDELSKIAQLAAVTEALTVIQPLQVKNVATIAGAICTALPFFDLPVALVALDAIVKLAPTGRILNVSEFIRGYFSTDLELGEFVQEISIPLSKKKEHVGSAFQKFGLTGDDWAIVNCGAFVGLDHETISNVRLCFGGGIGEKPKRPEKTQKLLEGVRATDEERIRTILEENLSKELETISDIRASSEYRMHLAKVLGRRAISLACRRALESSGN